AVAALLAATAYLMISGGSVSTQRAWMMLAIMLVAVLADRPALTMRNVALAAILIIAITPSAVAGPSFQMSFAATAALIAAYAVLAARKGAQSQPAGAFAGLAPVRWMLPVLKAVLGLAITSLVAGLATGLFSAHHFHRVAGNGVLANLLAMPLVTFVVMPAGVLALLTMPFGLDEWPLRLMGKGVEGVIAAALYVQSLGGDFVVGQIPLAATVMAGSGFIVLVFLRSRLRLGGLALIGLGALLALPPLRGPGPDILVSEDGGLVALAGPGGLASNAARPNEFVFRQWQTALGDRPHVTPAVAKPARSAATGLEAGRTGAEEEDSEGTQHRKADGEGAATTAAEKESPNLGAAERETAKTGAVERETAKAGALERKVPQPAGDPRILDHLLARAAGDPSRFHCAGRGVCAALHRQARIIALKDAALVGAACDTADLVVVAAPIHMRVCRSGATLVTSRSLRTSGALTIRIWPDPTSAEASARPQPRSQASAPPQRTAGDRARPEFAVTAALGGIIRPWTIQRYYDWRSRSYDLPE
ncbi:ComEC/Rec2 family competence protein, partial [Hoeflea sp. BAL378]|uniref:ComEC/Rec2 family competence protein n=1 Tax=Hoeflea sp. BAL378 TaxID=1547437 RepID=UPI0005526357